MKKRALSLLLVLVMVCASLVTMADAQPEYATRGTVADMLLVAADDYTPGITRGDILKGYPDGNSREDQYITRAESFVMVSRAFGTLPEPVGNNARIAYPQETYTDVPEWAMEDILNLSKAGVVIGTGDGKLSPDDTVTVQQVQTMIRRIFALKGSNANDDFYNTINKEALDTSTIRPGEMSSSIFGDLQEKNNQRLTEIIQELAAKSYEKGTKEQKVSDYYKNVADMENRNQQGIQPIQPYLDAVNAADTLEKLDAAQQKIKDETGLIGLIGLALSNDLKDSTRHALYFYSISPSLPKDIYAGSTGKEQAYIDYLATLLELGGETDAQQQAEAYYALEQAMSAKQMNQNEYSDVDKIYNVYTQEQIQEIFPQTDIEKLIQNSGFTKPEQFIVQDPGVMEVLGGYYTQDNLPLLKTAVKLALLSNYGGTLGQAFIDAANTFQKAFMGVEGEKTAEEIASLATQSTMSDYLGEIYIEKYFPEEAKRDVERMVQEFIEIYEQRIWELDWMSESTKQMAKKKLDTMQVKMGYPDSWDSMLDQVEIKRKEEGGSYFENTRAISLQSWKNQIEKQNQPVDKSAWITSAYTVNAFYNATSNEIIFPAGILQSPFYDINALPEQNLGGIGMVIAHEITHAFDNNGAKFDEKGNAANWWTEEDYQKFQELCEKVVGFYDGYEAAPGITTNGTLTLSENIADIGGIGCALEAAGRLDNPSYEAFFTNMAKCWGMTCSREYQEYLAQLDVHSANMVRVNRGIVNFEEFYETYGITEDDGMYVPEEDRVQIW